MEVTEEVKQAKEVIQAFLKAKKNLRMYPPNNPIYSKTAEDTYKKLEEFLDIQNELNVRIKQNELFLGTDVIYHAEGKSDNLALFFFKDGLRDITFKRGISAEELQSFLEAIAFDFEREDVQDDIVTLLWEKDFQNIKYVVDDAVLTEDEQYEEEAIKQARGSHPEEDDLQKAYNDAFIVEEVAEVAVVPITDKDLKALVKEFEVDAYDKKDKLIDILFDILFHADSTTEFKDIVGILSDAIEFSIRRGDLGSAVGILKKAREMYNGSISDGMRRHLAQVFLFPGSTEIVKIIGELFDSGTLTDESVFEEYVGFLTKSSIPSFMTVLGELKTINARKVMINALTFLGSKDITTLAKGLKDDRWYVVRNIIYILRRIGDKKAVEYLTKAVKHSDVRVRKEVLKCLGELGGPAVVPTIRDCLSDPDSSVSISAVRSLGAVGSDVARRVLMERILDKGFIDKDFNEKKEYFEALSSRWKDTDTFEFLMRIARKKTLFKRAKNDEIRACAALGLGLMGNNDAISVLYKLRDSKNKFLSEYAYSAVKRIEYGK
ncbi:MAG: HEAT repeat domain-containing protein [Nitrospirae bacterium]|nr:HEAT repeat domain-containing protein [Nitrospirota bacterium]